MDFSTNPSTEYKQHSLIHLTCFKVHPFELQVLSVYVYSQFYACFNSLFYHLHLSRDYKTGKGHAQVLGSSIPESGSRVITCRERNPAVLPVTEVPARPVFSTVVMATVVGIIHRVPHPMLQSTCKKAVL